MRVHACVRECVCVCVCFHYPLLCVCTWVGEIQSANSSMGNHTWPHVTSFPPFIFIHLIAWAHCALFFRFVDFLDKYQWHNSAGALCQFLQLQYILTWAHCALFFRFVDFLDKYQWHNSAGALCQFLQLQYILTILNGNVSDLLKEDTVTSWTKPCHHIWAQSLHADES